MTEIELGTEAQTEAAARATRLRRSALALLAAAGAAAALASLTLPSGWLLRHPTAALLRQSVSAVEGGCAADGEDCRDSRCCTTLGSHCYEKNAGWAQCFPQCSPGVHADDPEQAPWTCNVLEPAAPETAGRDPTASEAPAEPSATGSRAHFNLMSAAEEKPAQPQTSTPPGGCAAEGGECLASRCCSVATESCFEKNEKWAMCSPGCIPGVHEDDPEQTPWSCVKLWSPEHERQEWYDAEAKAWGTVSQLTTDAKVSLLYGAAGGNGYAGYISPRIDGLQGLTMNDGPQGYNAYQERLFGGSTQFPALLSVAASFDPETSRRYAQAVAEEFVKKGCNVLLGPDVEVTRATLTGRSFETISGEDPFLGSKLVQPFVRAVQDNGIIAVVKHWLDNNQEIYRQTMNVEVGDRAQHEIYMPVFKAAFDAGAGGVMCAYNSVRGEHDCQSSYLLKTLLREELGFKGFIVSDWGATHDGPASIRAGLDIEMPGGDHLGAIPDLLASGAEDIQKDVDQMAVHVLSAMYKISGKFPVKDRLPVWGALENDATSDWHRTVAETTIWESAVLLKNEGHALPIATAGKNIAMVGKYCDALREPAYKQGSVWSGGGSGFVDTTRGTTPLQGLTSLVTDAAAIWLAEDGNDTKEADAVIVCVAAHGEEGWDRTDFSLPQVKDLVKAVRQHNKRKAPIIVLAAVPGAVETEWVEDVDAVLLMFMPGEQVGPAVAKLLTGQVAPSGRLPVSFPKKDEKRWTQFQYPGECHGKVKWCEKMVAHFTEGTLIGYRWNDAMGVPAAYPFGFGLAYTEFELSDFKATCKGKAATVTLKVTNVGDASGTAVPQLYVSFPSLAPTLRQLRDFAKVEVAPKGSASVTFKLGDEDWSYYDEAESGWKSALDKGESVTVSVGVSSADLKWTGALPCGRHEARKPQAQAEERAPAALKKL